MDSQNTHHTSPLGASYGASFVWGIFVKIARYVKSDRINHEIISFIWQSVPYDFW